MHERSSGLVGLSLFSRSNEVLVVDLTVAVFHVVGSGGDDHCIGGWMDE